MKLIDDWRRSHRLWSVRLSAAGMALSAGWVALPADTREQIPGAQWIGLVLFAAVAFARLVQQEPGDGK